MKIYTAFILAMLATTAFGQHTQSVTIGDNYNYGLTYSLPKTKIQVSVTATCTRVTAGQFAPYAEKLLGLRDVCLSDQTHCEVTSLSLQGMPKADDDRTFHINFPEKGYMPTIHLTDDRCLLAINRDPEVSDAAADESSAVAPVDDKPQYKPTDLLNADMLKAGSKLKQAELCAQEILSLRESRNELIRGEADNTPKDGLQLKLMLDNLAAQEAALLSLFVGTTETTPMQQTFTYLPTDSVDSVILFRFSSELGFVEPDDLSGAPYFLGLTIVDDNRMSWTDPKAVKRMEKGIAHCVPGRAHVRIFTLRDTLTEGDLPMAQFGHVEQLPMNQFTNAKLPSSAAFEPSTGAIKIFKQ